MALTLDIPFAVEPIFIKDNDSSGEKLIKAADEIFTSPNYPKTVNQVNKRPWANETTGYIVQLFVILRRTRATNNNHETPCRVAMLRGMCIEMAIPLQTVMDPNFKYNNFLSNPMIKYLSKVSVQSFIHTFDVTSD